MRALGKAIIFGLALAVTPILGCSSNSSKSDVASNSTENTGDLGLQLQVGSLTVNTVSYVLTNGTNSYNGTLNVADASTLTATIGPVQQGSGYNLTLTATATDGTSQCTGSAGPFTVTANQTVQVAIELRCTKARTNGSVLIDGTVNQCPDISSVIGGVPVNCQIPLSVAATDDGKPNPTLTYTWTGAPGLTGANPTLNCQSAGLVPLHVVVSDGDTAAGCDAPFDITVRCPAGCPLVAPTCTDGIQNQGETDVDCGGPNCGPCALGKKCVANGDCTTGLACSGGVCANPPSCTDGIQNQGETGIDCGGPCGPCPLCTAPLHDPVGTTCTDCEANNCPHDPVVQPSCSDFGTSDAALCTAALNCARINNCAANGVSTCYCGAGVSIANCKAGLAAGVCKSQIEAGLKSTDPNFITGNLVKVTLPAGAALSLVLCDHDFCGSINGAMNECLPYCK
jgi:hypothetical protein